MWNHVLAFALEFKDYRDIGAVLILVIGAIWLWRAGIPQQLFGGYQKLAALREAERDQALKEKEAALGKVKDLEDYIKLLMLDAKVRMEAAIQEAVSKKIKEQ